MKTNSGHNRESDGGEAEDLRVPSGCKEAEEDLHRAQPVETRLLQREEVRRQITDRHAGEGTGNGPPLNPIIGGR